jgi:putative membrane protein
MSMAFVQDKRQTQLSLKTFFMKSFSKIFMAAGCALLVLACNDDDNEPQLSLSAFDRTFITEASYGNHAEADLGKVADSISTNDSVSMFGEMMATDHLTAQADLSVIARNWNVNPPQSPDSAHLAMKQQLLTMTGVRFDTAYMNGQIMDHEKAAALYRMAIDSTKISSLRNYASKYLPRIEMHLDHARRIRTSIQ